MIKKNNKKAFTLVELLVVIAILAVLSAVAIVGYSSFTKRANISNDGSLIKEVNDYIKALSYTDTKLDTIEDVRLAVKGDTIDFASAKPFAAKSNYHYGFNIKSKQLTYLNEFVAAEGFDEIKDNEKQDVFVFVSNNTEASHYTDNGYSLYLQEGLYEDTLNIKAGLDVGVNSNLSSVNYTNSTSEGKEVVIRTNSFDTTLTINAPKDTVKHYDKVGSLNVIAVANASYHENGEVKFVEISNGRIVLEENSEVAHIHINAKEELSEGENAFDKVIISYDKSVDLTEVGFSRDDVEINETKGTLVVALQAGTETPTESTEMDYVWLTKQGIYEQIVVSDNGDNKENTGAEKVEWVDTSNKSAETKDAAQKIANNYVSETVRPTWSATDNERDLADITNATAVATAVAQEEAGEEWANMNEEQKVAAVTAKEAVVVDATQAVEAQPDKADVETGATLFAGGTGTEKDPWLIVDYDTMQHVTTVSKTISRAKAVVAAIGTSHDYNYYAGFYGSYHESFSGYSTYDEYFETEWLPYKSYVEHPETLPTNSYYFKVKDGITSIDCCENGKTWKAVTLYGHFDGNGVLFNNLSNQSLFNTIEAWNGSDLVTAVVKDLTVNANIVRGTNTAAAISYQTRDTLFSNITVHGYVEGGSNSGLFVAYGPNIISSDYSKWLKGWNVVFDNCSSDATMVNTNGAASALIGHPTCDESKSSIIVNNYQFTGNLYTTSTAAYKYSSVYCGNIVYVDGSSTGISGNTNQAYSTISYTTESLPNKHDGFSVSKLSGFDHAVASLIISPNGLDEKGGFTGTYMIEKSEENELTITDATISTSNLKFFDIKVNSDDVIETKVMGESGYTSDGNTYVVIGSSYGKTYANASVRIIQYNAQGIIIGISIFTLPVE